MPQPRTSPSDDVIDTDFIFAPVTIQEGSHISFDWSQEASLLILFRGDIDDYYSCYIF